MRKRIDLAGRRFGKLVVVSPAGVDRHSRLLWAVRCDCGEERVSPGVNLRCGKTASCGCSRAKHGRHGTPEYVTWRAMKARCLNPRVECYPDYGGRGIRVCATWLDDFAAFFADVGPQPGPGFQLDRIDNDGDHEPGNVRWATAPEQGRNRRTNAIVEVAGERLTVVEWSERTGLGQTTIRERLRHGWSPERAVSTPVRQAAGGAR